MKPWISLEEQEPKIGQRCLVLLRDPSFPVWRYVTMADYMSIDNTLWHFDKEVKRTYITHWMPQPELPEES